MECVHAARWRHLPLPGVPGDSIVRPFPDGHANTADLEMRLQETPSMGTEPQFSDGGAAGELARGCFGGHLSHSESSSGSTSGMANQSVSCWRSAAASLLALLPPQARRQRPAAATGTTGARRPARRDCARRDRGPPPDGQCPHSITPGSCPRRVSIRESAGMWPARTIVRLPLRMPAKYRGLPDITSPRRASCSARCDH